MEPTRDGSKHVRIASGAFLDGGRSAGANLAPLKASADAARSARKASENHPATVTALSDMTAAVFAHEVANPLAGIAASLQFLERSLEKKQINDPTLTTTMRAVRREVDRLGCLLKEFRCLRASQCLEPRSSDLKKIIAEVLTPQERLYQSAGINIEWELSDSCPRVNVDPAKIKQVILNLCKNAVEAMPQGGSLKIKCYASGPSVVLEISDNGVGIPKDMNILRRKGGGGLGLKVAEQIITAHKGVISYRSHPGRGTTFKLLLPAMG